jgi:hypothetical protein
LATSKKSQTEEKIEKPKKKSISIASRKAKGRNLQKWTAKHISELLDIPWGKDCLIASREMGQSGTDVRLIGDALKRFPFSVETKAQETWSMNSFIEQAKSNQMENTDWILFVKKNNNKPVVVMDADCFFKLLERMGYGKNN